ncbi:hypothetical protein E2C01_050553 [Portunus trituberculatus]|uniref:Uncharacterized protein n=1 Tax=Portunus trituberculatus TaxID=210409 RepID=A0A5B7G8L5_PORTR|nr:hypothetical protein [Portunus trituberculatus]
MDTPAAGQLGHGRRCGGCCCLCANLLLTFPGSMRRATTATSSRVASPLHCCVSFDLMGVIRLTVSRRYRPCCRLPSGFLSQAGRAARLPRRPHFTLSPLSYAQPFTISPAITLSFSPLHSSFLLSPAPFSSSPHAPTSHARPSTLPTPFHSLGAPYTSHAHVDLCASRRQFAAYKVYVPEAQSRDPPVSARRLKRGLPPFLPPSLPPSFLPSFLPPPHLNRGSTRRCSG